MRKYIDADKLEKDGWNMQRIRQVSSTEMVYETKKPTDFPAADVQEVRHGRWNELPYSYECSVCGIVRPKEMTGKWHYCPNCGSRMVDEDKEMSKVSEMEMAYGEYLND